MERDEPRRASEAEILTRGLKTSLTRNTHNTHTHDVKQDSGENKKISRILQHPQVIFHSCLLSKKLVNHFSPKENSPKPSLPLTSKNRTAQNASKNGVYKTPENNNQFSIDYNSASTGLKMCIDFPPFFGRKKKIFSG